MIIARIRSFLAAQFCRLRFGLEKSSYKSNIKYACVSEKYGYIYFRVPKSANTTVTSSLLANDPEKDKKGIRKDAFDNLTALNFKSIAGYKIFTVVRNPYTRLLSAYIQKVKNGSKRHLLDTTGDVSFEDFIQWLENGGLYKNGHWMPQHKIVPASFPGLITIKMENLDAELGPLLQDIDSNMKIKTRQSHSTGSNSLIADYYTPELVERVYALYKEDFIRFAYDRSL